MRVRHGLPLLAVVAIACLLAGCPAADRGDYTIKGKVTLNGAPVTYGPMTQVTVNFASAENSVGAEFQPDGTFEVELPAGTYKLDIVIKGADGNDTLAGKYRSSSPDAQTYEAKGDDSGVEIKLTN